VNTGGVIVESAGQHLQGSITRAEALELLRTLEMPNVVLDEQKFAEKKKFLEFAIFDGAECVTNSISERLIWEAKILSDLMLQNDGSELTALVIGNPLEKTILEAGNKHHSIENPPLYLLIFSGSFPKRCDFAECVAKLGIDGM
jgi:hypothetical protein